MSATKKNWSIKNIRLTSVLLLLMVMAFFFSFATHSHAITITGSETVTTNSNTAYTATGCSGSVSWSVTGTGASINSNGVLTTGPASCGGITVTAHCSDGSIATKEIRVSNAGQWVQTSICGYPGNGTTKTLITGKNRYTSSWCSICDSSICTGRICDPSSNCSGSYPYTCCGYPKLGCGNPGTATPAIGEVGGGGGCCNYSALITHVCHIIGNKVDEWQCPPCTNGQTQSCYSGASETKGIGECRAGTQTCTNGQWGACVGEILPSTEVCGNNTDENCDGNIDEGCAVCEDKDGDGYYAYNPVSCSQGNDCNDNDASINPGAKEKCDGIDNNCDGQKDETCLGNQCGEMKRTDEKGQMKRGQATFRVGMDIENAERS